MTVLTALTSKFPGSVIGAGASTPGHEQRHRDRHRHASRDGAEIPVGKLGGVAEAIVDDDDAGSPPVMYRTEAGDVGRYRGLQDDGVDG